MSNKFLNAGWVAIFCILLLAFSAFASQERQDLTAGEQRAIRTLISRWVEAYRELDARRLAALETPDVVIVDRFGEVHVSHGRHETERLWSDAFAMVSTNTPSITVTIDHIQFIRPDAAVVQASWRFAEGILLTDGERIPPYSQVDTYVLIKRKNVWLVAAHNMQEKP